MPADPLDLELPPGATPELAVMLSGISDPAHRDTITRAWHALSEGVEDHTVTQLAALFGAVLRANEARTVRVLQGFTADIGDYLDSRGDAGSAATETGSSELHRHIGMAATIKAVLAPEILRAETAARAVNVKVLTIGIIAGFLGGVIVGAWLFHH